MGIIITRPVLIDGKTSVGGGEWIASGNVIDAKMILENFQEVYKEINGNLHGSNLGPIPPLEGKIWEQSIQFPEFIYTSSSDPRLTESYTEGKVHSHNGVDSSVLAMGSINRKALRCRSFGAWQYPSCENPGSSRYNGSTLLVLFGSCEITGVPGALSSFSFMADMPYNRVRFGDYYHDSSSGVPGTDYRYPRAFVQPRVSDPNLEGKIVFATAAGIYFKEYITGPPTISWADKYPYLKITISLDSGTFPNSINGLFIDWVVALQVYTN